MDPRRILESPAVYHAFQRAGGFFGARIKAIAEYLPATPANATVFDIGCGPGYIVPHLPAPINYHGFDTDKAYIDFANEKFKGLGAFHHVEFDETAAQFGLADVVMMNGVVHHLSDQVALKMFADIRQSLKPGGVLFTSCDGCFREGQNPIAKWMLEHDRGEFVRTEPEYRKLLESVFPKVETHVRDDLSWFPYTWCVTVCRA